jgi:SHS2 domain-containing protein
MQTPLSGFEAEPLDTAHDFHVTGTHTRTQRAAVPAAASALTRARALVRAGHDMQSLLYAFLDELLFVFLTEFMVVRELTLRRIERGATWELRATGCVRCSLYRTEWKTALRSHDCTVSPPAAVCVCSPLSRPARRGSRFVPGRHEQGTEVKAITYSAMQIHERDADAEVFVIVDI